MWLSEFGFGGLIKTSVSGQDWLLEFGLRLFNNKSGSDKLMGPSAKSFYVEFNLPWEDNKIIEII